MNRNSQRKTLRLSAIATLMGLIWWIVLGSVCMAMGKDTSIAGSDTKADYLTPQQIVSLENKALAGDGDAAFRLASYWKNYEINFKEAAYWLQIGAENGHIDSQWSLAAYMQSIPSAFGVAADDAIMLKRLEKRAKFWEKKAQEQEKKSKQHPSK